MEAIIVRLLNESLKKLEEATKELNRLEACYKKPTKDSSVTDIKARLFYKEMAKETFAIKEQNKVISLLIGADCKRL